MARNDDKAGSAFPGVMGRTIGELSPAWTAFALIAALAAPAILHSQATPDRFQLPLRITAWALNTSNVATGANSQVQINIDRWSTNGERDGLIKTFQEKGPDKLLDSLAATRRVGFMRLPNTLGYDLHFARLRPQADGGAQIVLMTDRYVGRFEARNQPRTSDYPFTLVDIRVKPDGTGEGKLSVATKISYNKEKQVVELENYATEPVRLQNLEVAGRR